jgi:two-component system, NtrC family, response regulator AtoC
VADGGTLFISEVGALAPALQLRLVELLEHAAVRRMGGTREVPVDVRVVAATRHLPGTLVRAGRLLPELYRRFADSPLELVPLRERGDDLWLLAHRFTKWQAERHGFAPPDLNGEARSMLARHAWPGNVRELRHALERAVLVQSGGIIDGRDIALTPSMSTLPAPQPAPDRSLLELERDALTRALGRAYGNVSQAARLLGISRDTMRYRIAKHELERAQPDGARA